MNAEQYAALSRPFRDNPAALRTLVLVNDGLKWLCYLLYPMLLIVVTLYDPSLLLKEILVPAVLFIGLSVFRRFYNAPRPYEALAIDPLIHKDTQGKSFPSRHIFSVFMIAMCWLAYCPLVGIALLAGGVVMAVVRVIGGVHYPRDVIAGALVAVLGGILGLWILPLS